MGVSLTKTPLNRDPLLDGGPPGQRLPGQRPPLDGDPQTETPLDRYPQSQTPLYRDPQTETPGQRPPWDGDPPDGDRDPPGHRQTPVKT